MEIYIIKFAIPSVTLSWCHSVTLSVCPLLFSSRTAEPIALKFARNESYRVWATHRPGYNSVRRQEAKCRIEMILKSGIFLVYSRKFHYFYTVFFETTVSTALKIKIQKALILLHPISHKWTQSDTQNLSYGQKYMVG